MAIGIVIAKYYCIQLVVCLAISIQLIILSRCYHDVVHNRDEPEIYENPLIERTIMGLLVCLEKST